MYFDENNNYFDIMMAEQEFEFNKNYNKNKINDIDVDVNIDSINFNREDKLYSPLEGFNKGNMFRNLYSKYKNHVYKLKVSSKRDELLYQIQMYMFAMKDINLYLDLHPDDSMMLKKYYDYRNKYNELKKKYENEYSPLCTNNVMNSSKWTWIDNTWPWDKGGN